MSIEYLINQYGSSLSNKKEVCSASIINCIRDNYEKINIVVKSAPYIGIGWWVGFAWVLVGRKVQGETGLRGWVLGETN